MILSEATRLPCEVPTSTSRAVWGSVSCPRTLLHADQGNWPSDNKTLALPLSHSCKFCVNLSNSCKCFFASKIKVSSLCIHCNKTTTTSLFVSKSTSQWAQHSPEAPVLFSSPTILKWTQHPTIAVNSVAVKVIKWREIHFSIPKV